MYEHLLLIIGRKEEIYNFWGKDEVPTMFDVKQVFCL